MPLSDFCNRLTTTCTQHGPSDSRACPLPDEPLAGPPLGRHRSAFGRWTSSRSTGRASLDGDPPASAIAHDPFPARGRSLRPDRSRRRGHHAVLAELRSTAPPRDASRSRRFQPRTGLVTWPLTPPSDPPSLPQPFVRRGRGRATVPEGPPRPPPRQRQRSAPDQGAFHRRQLPPRRPGLPARLPARPLGPASRGSRPFRTALLPSVPEGSPPHARGDSPRAPRRHRCR